MKFQIQHRYSGAVLFEIECGSMRLCLEAAIGKRADLYGANLRSADLYGANLRSADLYGANLHGANLRSADLYGANLRSADLYGANLRGANLRGADLYGANLRSADLYGANLRSADLRGANLRGANLRGADLYGANLRSADLYGANLRSADLRGADLHGANLRSADLYGANLRGADLHGADLRSAKGIEAWRTTPLMLLLDQPGVVRAYKLVTAGGVGPFNGGITYVVGESYEVADANTDPQTQCGPGINVASMDWCLREWQEGYRVLVMEFTAADIACIPIGTDGKFRLHRCKVVAEKDLAELMPKPVAEEAAA